jgi:hypothetical protein
LNQKLLGRERNTNCNKPHHRALLAIERHR